MRIVSQDNDLDFPYENIAISTGFRGDKKEFYIFAHLINCVEMNKMPQKLATYSTEGKAQKAMEMLREQYSRLQVVKILASGTCEHMEKSLSKDEFLECNLKYREMNIFQFPKDEDAEV